MLIQLKIETENDAKIAAELVAKLYECPFSVNGIVRWDISNDIGCEVVLAELGKRKVIPRKFIDDLGLMFLDKIKITM